MIIHDLIRKHGDVSIKHTMENFSIGTADLPHNNGSIALRL